MSDRSDPEFDSRAIWRGGLRVFRAGDAIQLIRRCRERGVCVLGIDAFREVPEGVQPSMADSVDLSAGTHVEPAGSIWDFAEQFVRERDTSELLFEIVLEDADSRPVKEDP